ncbi:MAG: O-antigen ligase family protein [Hyphomicrobiales bacterium]|nr:O-antigen ligase family protein [Hyphomicrobiales bacterium]
MATIRDLAGTDRSAEPRSLGRVIDVAAVMAILIYWTEILRILFPGTDGVSAAFRLTHFAIYGMLAAMILASPGPVWPTLRRAPMLLAFTLLPIVSTAWSVEPQETLQRSIALIGCTLLALHLAAQRSGDEIVALIAAACTLAAAISLALIIAVPSVGLMQGEGVGNAWAGTWAGAHIHKNALGQMAGLGVVVCLIAWMNPKVAMRPLAAAGLVLNAVLVAGSRSLSAQFITVAVALMVIGAGTIARLAGQLVLPIVILLVGALLCATLSLSVDDLFDLLGAFGKDATMSSRVPLWTLLAEFIQDRWWLGYGYEAFWTEGFHAGRFIESRLYFRPHYAHNGYVELWLGLGAVGVGLFALLAVRLVWFAMKRIAADPSDPAALLALGFVTMYLLQNVSEATILARNNMNWVLFATLLLAMLRPTEPADAPRASRPRLLVR